HYAYLPFGGAFYTSLAISNPFQFGGQFGAATEANGQVLMRARFLETNLGRFDSSDPLGVESGDVNLYSYVLNSPVDFIDPSGLIPWSDLLKGKYQEFCEETLGGLYAAAGISAAGRLLAGRLFGYIGGILGTAIGPEGTVLGIIVGTQFGRFLAPGLF